MTVLCHLRCCRRQRQACFYHDDLPSNAAFLLAAGHDGGSHRSDSQHISRCCRVQAFNPWPAKGTADFDAMNANYTGCVDAAGPLPGSNAYENFLGYYVPSNEKPATPEVASTLESISCANGEELFTASSSSALSFAARAEARVGRALCCGVCV